MSAPGQEPSSKKSRWNVTINFGQRTYSLPAPPLILALLIQVVLAVQGLIGVVQNWGRDTPPPSPSPTGLPTVMPTRDTPTPTPTPLTLEQIIEQELKKLKEGKIAFDTPESMKQGEAGKVVARITSQNIGEQLTEGLKGNGSPEVQNIKVGTLMKVFLYAEKDHFDITGMSSEQQIVAGQPYAHWEWSVTPKTFGSLPLHLRATVNIVVKDVGEKSIDVPVIERSVDVKVSPMYIVWEAAKDTGTWGYIIGGGSVAGAVGGIWAWLRHKKKNPAGFKWKR